LGFDPHPRLTTTPTPVLAAKDLPLVSGQGPESLCLSLFPVKADLSSRKTRQVGLRGWSRPAGCLSCDCSGFLLSQEWQNLSDSFPDVLTCRWSGCSVSWVPRTPLHAGY